jgi:hypothetical protein
MFNCERCGSSFSPLRAATLGSCPRCQGRDGVAVPLSFKLFAAEPVEGEVGRASVVAEELVEGAAAKHGARPFGDHV